MPNEIKSVTDGVTKYRLDKQTLTAWYGSGEVLEMSDGSKWFHPYSGKAPWKL